MSVRPPFFFSMAFKAKPRASFLNMPLLLAGFTTCFFLACAGALVRVRVVRVRVVVRLLRGLRVVLAMAVLAVQFSRAFDADTEA
mmetsp:Transcript_11940/g.26318  ORF Transcript_11940/g.26318 Transcript_11940/m.26318 type:complete len:85 (+) Transcript_11940:1907-2161(+)